MPIPGEVINAFALLGAALSGEGSPAARVGTAIMQANQNQLARAFMQELKSNPEAVPPGGLNFQVAQALQEDAANREFRDVQKRAINAGISNDEERLKLAQNEAKRAQEIYDYSIKQRANNEEIAKLQLEHERYQQAVDQAVTPEERAKREKALFDLEIQLKNAQLTNEQLDKERLERIKQLAATGDPEDQRQAINLVEGIIANAGDPSMAIKAMKEIDPNMARVLAPYEQMLQALPKPATADETAKEDKPGYFSSLQKALSDFNIASPESIRKDMQKFTHNSAHGDSSLPIGSGKLDVNTTIQKALQNKSGAMPGQSFNLVPSNVLQGVRNSAVGAIDFAANALGFTPDKFSTSVTPSGVVLQKGTKQGLANTLGATPAIDAFRTYIGEPEDVWKLLGE